MKAHLTLSLAALALATTAHAQSAKTESWQFGAVLDLTHTTRALVGEWERPYGREVGAFPAGPDPDKYWPPVARIDQAYGDRNLL